MPHPEGVVCNALLTDLGSAYAQVLGADGILYQSLEDLLSVGQELNPAIHQFEASCFTGAHA